MRVTIMHLQRSKKSGLLSYRRRFPDELVELIPSKSPEGRGRREFKVSLRASDISDPVARARYAAAEQEYDAIVAKAQRVADKSYDGLEEPLITYLAERYAYEHLEADEAMRWKRKPKASAEYVSRGHPEDVYLECREMLEERDGKGLVIYWKDWAIEYGYALGFLIDPRDPKMLDLCRALAEKACEIWLAVDKRIDGDEVATPSAPRSPQDGSRRASSQRSQAGKLSLLELYDHYAATPGRSLKTV